jgi:hypothetical protein
MQQTIKFGPFVKSLTHSGASGGLCIQIAVFFSSHWCEIVAAAPDVIRVPTTNTNHRLLVVFGQVLPQGTRTVQRCESKRSRGRAFFAGFTLS